MTTKTPTQQPAGLLCGADDLATVALVVEALDADAEASVAAAFFDQSTSEIFRSVPRVEALAWGSQLARRIATELPPNPVGSVAPPPIVVGDAPMARLVATQWVKGWAEPGARKLLHCVGHNGVWAQEAKEESEPDGTLTWSESSLRPGPVLRRVRELLDEWTPPATFDPTGPAVFVATDDEVTTVAIASAIAHQVPGARVAAIVSGVARWPGIPGVRLFSLAEARQPGALRHRSPSEELARLLLADYAWLAGPNAEATAPPVSLFGSFTYDGEVPLSWDNQPGQTQAAVSLVAEACGRVLSAGQVELGAEPTPGGAPIILSPTELRAMACTILSLLEVDVDDAHLLTALEVAVRLPVLATRAGLSPVRPPAYQPLLDHGSVEVMAQQVHLAYLQVSQETSNATQSSLANAFWGELDDFEKASNRAVVTGSAIAHAMLGFEWRHAKRPVAPEFDAVIEALAELEHRRWAINQRINGRQNHKWAIAWDKVTDGAKEYDAAIVRAIPAIFATMNLEVVRSSS